MEILEAIIQHGSLLDDGRGTLHEGLVGFVLRHVEIPIF